MIERGEGSKGDERGRGAREIERGEGSKGD